MLGYLLFMAIRVWGASFNFIFMSHTYNFLATAVGVALSIFLYKNDIRTPMAAATTATSPPNKPNPSLYPGVVSTAVGFGALIYLTQLIYGEVSVVTRWAVAPYPDHGPYPYPWG